MSKDWADYLGLGLPSGRCEICKSLQNIIIILLYHVMFVPLLPKPTEANLTNKEESLWLQSTAAGISGL